ncbi:caskin-1-like [Acinonyx jubatus]|uniref:Caskin-1-like n=1 Tax=Acinonyx jubatus TaxID=32536 RepID=A0ABM3PYS5_ACIJB|nr:caskin-1-like [Acinonyx jubatus]
MPNDWLCGVASKLHLKKITLRLSRQILYGSQDKGTGGWKKRPVYPRRERAPPERASPESCSPTPALGATTEPEQHRHPLLGTGYNRTCSAALEPRPVSQAAGLPRGPAGRQRASPPSSPPKEPGRSVSRQHPFSRTLGQGPGPPGTA